MRWPSLENSTARCRNSRNPDFQIQPHSHLQVSSCYLPHLLILLICPGCRGRQSGLVHRYWRDSWIRPHLWNSRHRHFCSLQSYHRPSVEVRETRIVTSVNVTRKPVLCGLAGHDAENVALKYTPPLETTAKEYGSYKQTRTVYEWHAAILTVSSALEKTYFYDVGTIPIHRERRILKQKKSNKEVKFNNSKRLPLERKTSTNLYHFYSPDVTNTPNSNGTLHVCNSPWPHGRKKLGAASRYPYQSVSDWSPYITFCSHSGTIASLLQGKPSWFVRVIMHTLTFPRGRMWTTIYGGARSKHSPTTTYSSSQEISIPSHAITDWSPQILKAFQATWKVVWSLYAHSMFIMVSTSCHYGIYGQTFSVRLGHSGYLIKLVWHSRII